MPAHKLALSYYPLIDWALGLTYAAVILGSLYFLLTRGVRIACQPACQPEPKRIKKASEYRYDEGHE